MRGPSLVAGAALLLFSSAVAQNYNCPADNINFGYNCSGVNGTCCGGGTFDPTCFDPAANLQCCQWYQGAAVCPTSEACCGAFGPGASSAAFCCPAGAACCPTVGDGSSACCPAGTLCCSDTDSFCCDAQTEECNMEFMRCTPKPTTPAPTTAPGIKFRWSVSLGSVVNGIAALNGTHLLAGGNALYVINKATGAASIVPGASGVAPFANPVVSSITGLAYVATEQGAPGTSATYGIYAVNATSGLIAWSANVGEPNWYAPALSPGDGIVMLAGCYYVRGYNSRTGAVMWNFAVNANYCLSGGIAVVSSQANKSGSVGIVVSGTHLYGFDVTTGRGLFAEQFSGEGSVVSSEPTFVLASSPTRSGQTVTVAGPTTFFAPTGAVLWRGVNNSGTTMEQLASAGHVVVNGDAVGLQGYSAENGALLWNLTNTSLGGTANIVGTVDGYLFVSVPAPNSQWFGCIDANSGRLVWRKKGIAAFGPLARVGHLLYVFVAGNTPASTTPHIAVFDVRTGRPEGQSGSLHGGNSAGPVIGTDGTAYIGSWDTKLYALQPVGQ